MTSSPRTQARSTMRALVFDGVLRLGQLPTPRPEREELLLRVSTCAISRQDIEMVQGRRPVQVRPVVLGHQYAGEVLEAGGPVGEEWVGRRVVVDPWAGCGRCLRCRGGQGWLCAADRSRLPGLGLLDGAFAEYVSAPARAVRELPDDVDDEEAVFVLPVAAAIRASQLVVGPAPQRVLVVGDGNMGLLLTLMLHAAGHTVSVFGRHPSRRELLWRSGISFSGVPDAEGAALHEMPDAAFARESFGTVFECSGRSSGLELAGSAVRSRGRIVLLSHYAGQAGADLRGFAEREVELVGVNGGPVHEAITYLGKKLIDTLPLVSARYALEDGVGAFEKAAQRGMLRVILENPRGPGER